MLLTLSKRIRFEAAYRLDYPKWSTSQFKRQYGNLIQRDNWLGSNFEAFFIFAGPVDGQTGMIINVADIKARIGSLLDERYDHKCLNDDNAAFSHKPPTVENIARQLLADMSKLFDDSLATLAACHLIESPDNQATAYADDRIEKHTQIEFSAARQTCSPNLTLRQNLELFGQAAKMSGHGHNYRLRVTLEGDVDQDSGLIVPEKDLRARTRQLFELFDHKHLNEDVPELKQMPITTESLARWMFHYLSQDLPVARVELAENPWFSVEYAKDEICQLNVRDSFRAAHRLHSPLLNDSENLTVYGKCNNPNGHGHRYLVQAGTSGKIDDRTGTLLNLSDLVQAVKTSLTGWNGKFLDRDLEAFSTRPSTSENIVHLLHPKIESALGREISRLRLWETENNRFTLRR